MENDKIVKAMQEFVTETIKNSNVKVDKYSIEEAVENYMRNDFCMSEHIDTYDVRDRVGSWCDDNVYDMVNDVLSRGYVTDIIESAISDRDISDDVQQAIDNNLHSVVESLDYKRLAKALIEAIKEDAKNG